MIGMYWCARSVEGEADTSRIRDCNAWGPPSVVPASPVVLFGTLEDPMSDSDTSMDSRLIYDSASVRAPAIMVDVLEVMASGVVLDRRSVRFCNNSSSTRRKGRYLLPLLEEEDEGGLTLSLSVVVPDDPDEEGPLSFSRFADSDRLLSRS